jgi:HNH endonuclease
MFKYSLEQIEFLAEHYKSLTISDLTPLFNKRFKLNKSSTQLRAALKNRKLKSGRTGQFVKGQFPWNTGTKGATGRNKTSFKKGNPPLNLKPIGHERVCSKDNIVLVKVDQVNPYTGAQGFYRAKHVVIYEREHGPVPKGMVVRFIDHDKRNFDLSNLEAVSKALNLRLNKMRIKEMCSEVKPTARLVAELEVETFAKSKEVRKC